MKPRNKTIAAWLAFLGGPLGLHRFYLHGMGDLLGWMLPIPTALGVYGIERARAYGLDDGLSWVLIPLVGFVIAGCALTAIVYGLMAPEKWNARFNAGLGLLYFTSRFGGGLYPAYLGVGYRFGKVKLR